MHDTLISNEDMTEIFMRGLAAPDALSEVETARFYAWWMRANFIMQNGYFQTQQGLVDAATFNSVCTLFTDISGVPQFEPSCRDVQVPLLNCPWQSSQPG